MLELLKNTRIVKKRKFIFACIFWLLATFLFGVVMAAPGLVLLATIAAGGGVEKAAAARENPQIMRQGCLDYDCADGDP